MSDDALRILLIEDNPGDARYIREMLKEATELGERTFVRRGVGGDVRDEDDGGPPTLVHESRLSSGLDRLREEDVDVVLLDLNLPDSEKLETLTAIRQATERVPVIVLTGVRDREMGMEAFHRGADEYLVKAQINSDLLVRSIYHAVVHKRDERELRRQRDRLRAKSERLDEFAGVVAHDLRNPLSVAAGSLELARETGDEEHLERVEDALDRMGRLVDDLLRLSRQGDRVEDPEPVRLGAAAREAWTYVETDGAALDADALVGMGPILADSDRLAQLLENLFRNSIEHSSTSPRSHAREESAERSSASSRTQSDDSVEHGSTSGRAKPGDSAEYGSAGSRAQSDGGGDEGPDVTVRLGPLPSGFYVEDTGPGIPPEERSRVFEAGYTTDRSGTGFGLSIVRDIASAHGWEVAIDEASGGGARFEFTGVDYA